MRAALLAWALVGACGRAAAQLLAATLGAIPVEPAGPAAPVPPGTALRVQLLVQDAASLGRLLSVAPASASTLVLQISPNAHGDLPSPPDPLAASFIVDFKDVAVAGLGEQLRLERQGQPVDGQAVVDFVARLMKASMTANAQLASDVAKALRGDCTEYALLTAALARHHGMPARIVHGSVLLQADGRWVAYGHAWAQTLESGRWTLRDSALAQVPGPVYYVPALVLTNEGPGYRMPMLQGVKHLPSRIEVLGPVEPRP